MHIHTRKLLFTNMAAALISSSTLVACGGGGGGGSDASVTSTAVVPMVSSTVPVAISPGVTGVAINSQVLATFSKDMAVATLSPSTFLLACPAGANVAGVVSYVAESHTATFSPTANLPSGTACIATLTTGVQDATGAGLANAFTWTFVTGLTPDTTGPSIQSASGQIVPGPDAVGVATTTQILAVFNEAMDPATITSASFSLRNTSAGSDVAGMVSYIAGSKTAMITPSVLPANSSFTATITTGAKDLAGNPMATNKVWSFSTGSMTEAVAPTVDLTNPETATTGVCINKSINATFGEAISPATITTETFFLSTNGGQSVAGVVSYDPLTRIATFNPTGNLIGNPATSYTATLKGGLGGVKDLAGNVMTADKLITFTTAAATCAIRPELGSATSFGAFGGTATLTNDGLNTVIAGDVGANAASSSITGVHDSGGKHFTTTAINDGVVTGLVYTQNDPPGSNPGAIARAVAADALAAFNAISPGNLPGGIDMANLAECPTCGGAGGGPDDLTGRTLPPGIYLSTTGTYRLGTAGGLVGNLTLDAQGDANAVWVFQTAAGAGTFTMGLTGPATPGVPIQVLLVNGAQAKNIFWYVPAGATIGTGATLSGTLLADASITFSTTGGVPPTAVATTLYGRALALTAAVTMTNTVINVPAP